VACETRPAQRPRAVEQHEAVREDLCAQEAQRRSALELA